MCYRFLAKILPGLEFKPLIILGGFGGGGGGGKDSWLPTNERLWLCNWPMLAKFCIRFGSWWLVETAGGQFSFEEESSQVSGIVNVDSGGLNV